MSPSLSAELGELWWMALVGGISRCCGGFTFVEVVVRDRREGPASPERVWGGMEAAVMDEQPSGR